MFIVDYRDIYERRTIIDRLQPRINPFSNFFKSEWGFCANLLFKTKLYENIFYLSMQFLCNRRLTRQRKRQCRKSHRLQRIGFVRSQQSFQQQIHTRKHIQAVCRINQPTPSQCQSQLRQAVCQLRNLYFAKRRRRNLRFRNHLQCVRWES